MKKIILPTILLLLSSCASIIEGSKQNVSIKTNPNKPAICNLVGTGFELSTAVPASVQVPRSYYPLTVSCQPDDGTDKGIAKVLSDVSNWGYGGAVLGVGVGAGVDASTGAAFEYPDDIIVELGQTTTLGKTSMNSNVEQK